jgi:hypothetical protein
LFLFFKILVNGKLFSENRIIFGKMENRMGKFSKIVEQR